jgi:hypothetical protein
VGLGIGKLNLKNLEPRYLGPIGRPIGLHGDPVVIYFQQQESACTQVEDYLPRDSHIRSPRAADKQVGEDFCGVNVGESPFQAPCHTYPKRRVSGTFIFAQATDLKGPKRDLQGAV